MHFPFSETDSIDFDLAGGQPVCDGCGHPDGLCLCKPLKDTAKEGNP
jgi:hypothetical protein